MSLPMTLCFILINASCGENTEIVILQTRQIDNEQYFKLIFKSLGQDQLDKKFFQGNTLLTVRAVRDQTCDLNSPKFWTALPCSAT